MTPTGTLVVRAGVAEVVVYVDGEPRGHTDQTGSLSLVLELKSYQVRVERSGYRKAAAQTVSVTAGVPHLASFSLIPEVAALERRATNHPPEPNAEAMEQQEWERVRDTSDVNRLREYLRSHPSGTHVRDAESRVADLIWSSVDHGNVEAVARFVRENPGNPHSVDGQRILDQSNAEQQRLAQESARLEQAKQEKIKQELQNQLQNQPPQKLAVSNSALPAAPTPAQNDFRKQQVISTLAQFDLAPPAQAHARRKGHLARSA